MNVPTAILIAALLATLGWLYTTRRQWDLSRRQHTFNALLTMGFSKEFLELFEEIAPAIRSNSLSPPLDDRKATELMTILNHYEFLAAGIRNGDIDEKLLRDSEGGTIIGLVEASQDYIKDIRQIRNRNTVYEHLDWLYRRWKSNPPGRCQTIIEFFVGHPLYGKTSSSNKS